MRTEKKIQPDFSPGTRSEIVIPVPRTKGQSTSSSNEDSPKPKVPPRMKKKGPVLPEKPPHLRNAPNSIASTLTVVSPSQQATNVKDADPAKVQSFNQTTVHSKSGLPAKQVHEEQQQQSKGSQREILVAASKTARDRPIDRRQREPAKLLTAPPVPNKKTEDSDDDDDIGPVIVRIKPRNPKISDPPNQKKSEKTKGAAIFNFRKSRSPMVLIPRGHPLLDTRNLTHMWGGVYPTAYAMWLQSYENGDNPSSGLLRPIFGSSVDLRPYGVSTGHSRGQQRSRADTPGPRSGAKSPKSPKHSSTSVASSAKPRSSSVTRSGSLTSHGSTSSDSGNETFPKSVLKKHKRNSNKNSDRPEQKKNVTFNAFATVQLMEE